jgi:hypothetical protein
MQRLPSLCEHLDKIIYILGIGKPLLVVKKVLPMDDGKLKLVQITS